MKTKEIASAYKISVQAVNRWSPTKRQQAIRLLSAGVNPQVMKLVGEVQRLCYAASFFVGQNVNFGLYVEGDSGHFHIWHSDGKDDLIHVQDVSLLTEQNLNRAIAALNLIIEKY